VISVWPKPNTVISSECYNDSGAGNQVVGRGIGLEILTENIDYSLLEKGIPSIPERALLSIDGQMVSKSTFSSIDTGLELVIIDMQGASHTTGRNISYALSWKPELSKGTHYAKVTIRRDNGELIEYFWRFNLD
jgi:hypothetical protein